MPDETLSDEVQQRATAAMREAGSGANHQVGVDGDDPSVADEAADDTDHPTGDEQAAENIATESPS